MKSYQAALWLLSFVALLSGGCSSDAGGAGGPVVVSTVVAAESLPADVATRPWPQFLGPMRNNVSAETGLLDSWPEGGPELLWTATGIGEGYSSLAVADSLVLTMGNVGQNQAIIALDLNTGDQKWLAPVGDAFQEGMGNGPRGTPTVDGDRVYGLGGTGDLACVKLATGEIVWKKNILDFDANNIGWGISESVLIDGNRLICTPGGNGATLVALNKLTGELLWKSEVPGDPQAGYASAIAVEVGGVRQYVQFTSQAVVGVRADDGQFLWKDSDSANGTANCSSPLFGNDHVFTSSGYGRGGALVKLEADGSEVSSEHVYHTNDMANHHGGMVLVGNHLYGASDPGMLACIEFLTGEVAWQDRAPGKGSITYADGHLYYRSEQGPVTLVEATPEEYREKGRFDQPKRSDRPSWSWPVVADGKLFLRDQDTLLCYDVRG